MANNSSISNFIQESRQELKRVNWPTKKETVKYTVFVVLFSIGIAAFLGILDFIFVNVLENVVI
ncbi:preprotein translocase subunit SecE [Candidatus Jorgensenbacteria bacterium RIFCSPLOWO2_02_FULL_45_12]|uniref:Protein translocase subunit SecE n=2 Tax=Candidatus Joergenseniibacteriota TaxID=1752739 RepID=A0A1F6BPH9_9BACT|nr:MAG: Preprotein translocase subunit E [Candidatus Jorgensenbacteria bacterium GW2011_GWA2_45_9]OGG38825.1 MAG: preprotein translocase subunit SecE [Candidatus Jorgensenbacteria bacterium RIFCSPHIGHO2_02_FULL_45_20]OGG42500.1 MAG: preprotein translocase subunit SecE [Candidatus Jorgensenbacteria bacterium RIFCSPLOWO2_02_FULL_45_12]